MSYEDYLEAFSLEFTDDGLALSPSHITRDHFAEGDDFIETSITDFLRAGSAADWVEYARSVPKSKSSRGMTIAPIPIYRPDTTRLKRKYGKVAFANLIDSPFALYGFGQDGWDYYRWTGRSMLEEAMNEAKAFLFARDFGPDFSDFSIVADPRGYLFGSKEDHTMYTPWSRQRVLTSLSFAPSFVHYVYRHKKLFRDIKVFDLIRYLSMYPDDSRGIGSNYNFPGGSAVDEAFAARVLSSAKPEDALMWVPVLMRRINQDDRVAQLDSICDFVSKHSYAATFEMILECDSAAAFFEMVGNGVSIDFALDLNRR